MATRLLRLRRSPDTVDIWQDRRQGVLEEGVERLAADVTGLDLETLFDQAVRGTDDLDLAPLFAQVGIEMRLRPRRNGADQGGVTDSFESVKAGKTMGVRLDETQADAVVANALTGGPAVKAGLSAGDRIVAVDGLRVTKTNFESLVEGIPEGECITTVHAFRRDELMEFRVTLCSASHDTCELRIMGDASAAARSRRALWLGRPAGG